MRRYFPERRPDGTWVAEKIFTKRIPHTAEFQIARAKFDLYRDITRFVKQQSARAAAQGDDPRARAVGFLMSLYQRRLASSTQMVEDSGAEAKLSKLKGLLQQEGFFDHPEKRLLIFTEFKDTLGYLLDRLKSWGFRAGCIHGGMKPGARDERGTRLHAEQQFREEAIQMLVATEAGRGS